jgi:tRNA pseudouridine55 synthase
MDGVLVIDKPQGITSHDVVVAARRELRESRIGHTGTLDPLATGVLPLAIGRATRLVRFMTASDKEYSATVRFGLTTDSYDITGAETGGSGEVPSRETIVRAVRQLTGSYLQTPPAFSAKKVEGRRAYRLARQSRPVELAPVPVCVSHAELRDLAGSCATVVLTCSAGFYVRAFAHALGQLTGTGACLAALRRTRSGEFGLDATLPLDALSDQARIACDLIPIGGILQKLPVTTVTARGRMRVSHGRQLDADDVAQSGEATEPGAWVRLLDERGDLVALARAGQLPGSLHPSVVLI